MTNNNNNSNNNNTSAPEEIRGAVNRRKDITAMSITSSTTSSPSSLRRNQLKKKKRPQLEPPRGLGNQQQPAQEQPWLFQSSSIRPLPQPLPAPLSLQSSKTTTDTISDSVLDELSLLVPLPSAFSLGTSARYDDLLFVFAESIDTQWLCRTSSPFFLDATSLKSLLPFPRHHPRPKSGGYHVQSPTSSRSGRRVRKQVPARLEALSLHSPRRSKKRGRAIAGREEAILSPASAGRRKNALRLRTEQAEANHQTGSTRKRKSKQHQHKHNGSNKRQSALIDSTPMDDNLVGKPGKEVPPALQAELEEERRQKEHIAAQLNLTLEEYEALDAAFGDGSSDANDIDDEIYEGDGSMTGRYYQLFQEYDVDNSGAISPDELRKLLQASGEEMDDAELASVIQQADTDKDGEIDFHEFVGLMRARKRLLRVANHMGITGNGPSIGKAAHDSSKWASPALPPLKNAKKINHHLYQSPATDEQFNSHFTRATPRCLRPGARVDDVTALRRELALSEYGLQALDVKVREGLHWVQAHCPVTSLKAQVFCQRWGLEKVHRLFLRLEHAHLSRAWQKWRAFRMFERNKQKANLFLKCKGSQRLTALMARWRHRVTRRRLAKWQLEVTIMAREEWQSAAVELQRVARGLLARLRRRRLVQRIASTRLQALARGRLARALANRIRRVNLEHKSASLLQRCYRGYTGKRVAKALFRAQLEGRAACRIQRAVRAHQSRALRRVIERAKQETEAVVKIQSVWRGHCARVERHRRELNRLRERSSVEIQRWTRRWLAGRRVAEMRTRNSAAVTIQCFVRSVHARHELKMRRMNKMTAAQRRRERLAASRIQTRWRGHHARRQFADERQRLAEAAVMMHLERIAAAARIQRAFRGFRARRAAQAKRVEKLRWQHWTVLNRSALQIQSAWRGYHGRLASHLVRQAQHALELEQREAAVRIQAATRRNLAKRELSTRKRKQLEVVRTKQARTAAAVRIQKIVRGRRARQLALARQNAHKTAAQQALERLVAQTRERAACKIQRSVRGFLARMRLERRRQEVAVTRSQRAADAARSQAAVVLQCAWRRCVARRELVRKRHDLERRLSLMASEKARDEIERLRREQESELRALKLQLQFQESAAKREATKLKDELDRQREREEQAARSGEAEELARLRLEALMAREQHEREQEQRHTHSRGMRSQQTARRFELEQQERRDQVERDRVAREQQEQQIQTQEREELARLQLATLLGSTGGSGSGAAFHDADDQTDKQLAREAEQLAQAAVALQRQQAELKIQAFVLKRAARRRLRRLEQKQLAELASIEDEAARRRAKAAQDQELALAKLQALMDDEARAREQELRELEAQMLERARQEKERQARRQAAARIIQARARGFLGRRRVAALQLKLEQDREARRAAMEESLASALAEVDALQAEADADAQDGEDGGEDGEMAEGEEWVEYWDENAQASYFYNIRTQEASWTRPVTAGTSAKAMEIVRAAVTPSAAMAEAGNGLEGAEASDAGDGSYYADEYGYYDQYGQYHYYDPANEYAQQQQQQQQQQQMLGMMYPSYAAAYAYQAAAAMAFGQSMMFNPMASMPFVNPAAVDPSVMMTAMGQPPAPVEPATAALMATGGSGTEVPPDTWERFVDQYTGAAYYYNNLTGERYWA